MIEHWHARVEQCKYLHFAIFLRGVYHQIVLSFITKDNPSSGHSPLSTHFLSRERTDIKKFARSRSRIESLRKLSTQRRIGEPSKCLLEPYYIRICDKKEGHPEIEVDTLFFEPEDLEDEQTIQIDSNPTANGSIRRISLYWFNKQTQKLEASTSEVLLEMVFGGPRFYSYDDIYNERLNKLQTANRFCMYWMWTSQWIWSLLVASITFPFVWLLYIVLMLAWECRKCECDRGIHCIILLSPFICLYTTFKSFAIMFQNVRTFGVPHAFLHTWDQFLRDWEQQVFWEEIVF